MVKQMQSTGQPTKVVVPSEDGEKRCRIDMETSFSDLMPTRGVEADTSKRRQKYGGGNNSNFGPAAKVNGTLGWVLKTTVERRPDEKGLLGNKEERGRAHLGLISNRLETKVQKRPNEEGLLIFTEDCGPSHYQTRILIAWKWADPLWIHQNVQLRWRDPLSKTPLELGLTGLL